MSPRSSASLREPGRLRAFRRLTLQLTHTVVEPRLPEVTAPMLAFIGELDPDFRDPAAERDWIASLGAEAVLVPESGHYPQSQRPDVTVAPTVAFVQRMWAGRVPRAGLSRAAVTEVALDVVDAGGPAGFDRLTLAAVAGRRRRRRAEPVQARRRRSATCGAWSASHPSPS